MKIRCLIVDDEPIAQQILENFVKHVQSLECVGTCQNAFDALKILHSEKIDLLFLDIKMPSFSGLDLLKSLTHPPKVILTTAFSEFAVESYEYGVSDYLLKPISFDRFLKAVNKVLLPGHVTFQTQNTVENSGNQPDFIFLKADKKIHKIQHQNIIYIEGSGNYIKVYRQSEPMLMVLEKLSDLENKLPQTLFVRVHKSYLVNLSHIAQMEGNMLKVGNASIPVSASYKERLEKILNNDFK
ncbi:MAG: LytTR family DNA-binding domain-containing protein [Flammeovirgaceae bacterium]|jgi:DNA-binding LytR/AlgR family response regulator|nr:LytTR family DNA-binding domain-containing protein [Flammeovirgaceae bacterium]